ncbi:DUF192 domain-containing protein [Desulfovirgula thermocuniculi]|uniref:DUF192 domain-containing protein n=1 Tax=Desulfovirgula thermocuniculi TaxID=348842 RepID=UPI001B7FA538|nr:DUF192 domain-containing protein [Desulfovirgula thermocuniculi]
MREVCLVNLSRGTVLARRVRRAAGFLPRLVGLIGASELPAGEALILEGCRAVHTCFMRFPIDVAFLDGEGKVLAAVAALPPYRFTLPVRGARRAVELPAGTLAKTGTMPGDRLFLGNEGPCS